MASVYSRLFPGKQTRVTLRALRTMQVPRLLARAPAPARSALSRSLQVTQELQLGLPEAARRAMSRARQHSYETATSSSYLRIDLAHNAALVQQATAQLVQAQSQAAAGSSNAEVVVEALVEAQSAA